MNAKRVASAPLQRILLVRWLRLLLIGLLSVTLTACNGKGEGNNTPGENESTDNAKKEEPYTVTMVLSGSTQPDEARIEEKINEILESELNAKLDLVVLPWASSAQQVQLCLRSSDSSRTWLYSVGIYEKRF